MDEADRLDELLSAWEEGQRRGVDIPLPDLARDCPELLPELEGRIQALRQMGRLAEGDSPQPTTAFVPVDEKCDLPAGKLLLGRYRIENILGRGGMGQVYRARDQTLQRSVAIKIIRPSDPRLRERTIAEQNLRDAFSAEARIGANLNHPGIATVFDFGFQDKEPFIVFEYVDGQTLVDTIRTRGHMPLDNVRLILAPLAQALQFAHSRQLVHRDLKPANIRSTLRGQYKILDLGLALEFREATNWSFAGTPRYASPEQAADLPCDGRTDQYALALIAFEMLTGRPVFWAPDIQEMLRLHREQAPPSVREFLPDAPESVERALARALAKDPNQRFASCEEFAVALGCQFLTATAATADLLRLVKVDKMRGVWNCARWQFKLSHKSSKIHLALGGDFLWAYYRGELRRWPLRNIEVKQYKRRSRWLQLSLGGKAQAFRLATPGECEEWHAQFPKLQEILPAQAAHIKTATAAVLVEPVVFLRRPPPIRYQTLGMTDCTMDDRQLAETGLRIQASQMGADAIIDVQEERLADLKRTRWRQSGTAIRAVDSTGRAEMVVRWGSRMCKGLANRLLLLLLGVLTLHLVAKTSPLFVLGKRFDVVLAAWDFVVLVLPAWPLVIALCLRLTQIPQLLRPASLSVLALVLARPLIRLGTFLGLAIASDSLREVPLMWPALLPVLLFYVLLDGFLIVLSALYHKQSRHIYHEYVAARLDETRPDSMARRIVSRTAWIGTALFGLVVTVVIPVCGLVWPRAVCGVYVIVEGSLGRPVSVAQRLGTPSAGEHYARLNLTGSTNW